MPLVTEAVRGEGATLINDLGERFMPTVHPDAELAPRDVVARAIFEQMQRGRVVGLDATETIGEKFPREFPTVFGFCQSANIDPRTQRIPVAPAAHYHMGGIAVDEWGVTSLRGLWACGETSATGVHGANRLASNSLLEALVYGSRVATSVQAAPPAETTAVLHEHHPVVLPAPEEAQAIRDLRNVMYANVGLVRNELGLREALARISNLESAFPHASNELRNLLVVGRLVTQAALDRHESRGSHYRTDYPATDEALAKRSFIKLKQPA
jgi:L-aspartate oxidase